MQQPGRRLPAADSAHQNAELLRRIRVVLDTHAREVKDEDRQTSCLDRFADGLFLVVGYT